MAHYFALYMYESFVMIVLQTYSSNAATREQTKINVVFYDYVPLPFTDF